MANNSSAAKGFLTSLVLLIAAVIVFFLVLFPGRYEPVAPAPNSPKQLVNESKRQSMRHLAPHATESTTIQPKAPAAGEVIDNRAADVDLGVEVDPNADPDVQKAINLIDSGNVNDAVALLEGVLKKNPKDEQALVELAMVNLLDLKQPGQATGYLQRVVEINPGNQIVLSELVSLYEEQGKIDEGLNFLSDVFAQQPNSPDLSYGIGQLLSLQGKDADAIGYFDKATQSPSNQVRAYRDLGEAYSRSGNPDKAIESYDKAIGSMEKEIADKAGRGLPVQFAEERMNYTKMDKARELIRKGDLEQAQQMLDDVSKTMSGDEAVTALQETLNRRRAG